MLSINDIYIYILTVVFHFHFTEFCEYFTPMLLVEENWRILSTELVGNMVFKFPMYAIYNFNFKRFGNSLSFALSYGCNNMNHLRFNSQFTAKQPINISRTIRILIGFITYDRIDVIETAVTLLVYLNLCAYCV